MLLELKINLSSYFVKNLKVEFFELMQEIYFISCTRIFKSLINDMQDKTSMQDISIHNSRQGHCDSQTSRSRPQKDTISVHSEDQAPIESRVKCINVEIYKSFTEREIRNSYTISIHFKIEMI